MTQLYVNLLCERCGQPYGVTTGEYFGSEQSDEDVQRGLCFWCEVLTVEELRQRNEELQKRLEKLRWKRMEILGE